MLFTDEGLMSYLQMYSTDVCYVLIRWDMAWGKTVMNNKLNNDNKMSRTIKRLKKHSSEIINNLFITCSNNL